MVYKKFIKKRGRDFGPYYYESYRENGKVKKIYIGGEKEYRKWIGQKEKHKFENNRNHFVEQPFQKKYVLLKKVFFLFGLICLLIIILLHFGIFTFSVNEQNYSTFLEIFNQTSLVTGLVTQ
mgnify:CR=1 FL=1